MWPLYDEAPGYDDGGALGIGFGILVIIVILCFWIDEEIRKSKETSQKSAQKERDKRTQQENEYGYKEIYKTEKDRERIEREIKKLDDALEWIEELNRKRAKDEMNRRH